MGYVLLWLEGLAVAVLATAAMTAWAVRRPGRRSDAAMPVGVAGLILLAGAAGIAGTVVLVVTKTARPVWIGYTASWTAAYGAGAAVLLARGLRREEGGERRARQWSAGRLGLAAAGAAALDVMTFWNMDLAVRLQLAGLRAEGGALALAVAPARVADRSNAALAYQKAFDSIERFEKRPAAWDEAWTTWARGPDAEPGAKAPPFQASDPALRKFLGDHRRTVVLLRQAASMPDCYFERNWGRPSLDMLIPEIDLLRQSALLLALDARVRAADGEAGEALADAAAIFGLAGHARSEPLLISTLVGMLAEGIGLKTLEGVLADSRLTAEDLAQVTLEEGGYRRAVARAFQMEEAFGLSCFAMLAEEPGALGPMMDMAAAERWVALPLMGPWRVFLMPEDLAGYRRAVRRMQEAAARPYHEVRTDLAGSLRGLGEDDVGLLTRALVPALSAVVGRAAEGDARRGLARSALAAAAWRREHGRWPDSLEALVPGRLDAVPLDPFDGRPLRLEKTDGGIVLYSIGPDLRDEGGRPGTGAERTGDDLTFRLRGP